MGKILIDDIYDSFEETANRGEKRFKSFIEELFKNKPEASKLYFEHRGSKTVPDFIFFNQIFGYFLFEVKDISLDQVIRVDNKIQHYWYSDKNGGKTEEKRNYLEEMRKFCIEYDKEIEDNKSGIISLLKNFTSSKQRLISSNSAIVFTKFTSEDALNSGKFFIHKNRLNEKEDYRVLFKDDVDLDEYGNRDPYLIFKSLTWNTKQEIINNNIFNEIVCLVNPSAAETSFIKKDIDKEFSININLNKQEIKQHKKIIHILDNEQESYCNWVLIGGYKFIKGIAGSGKTLINLFAIKKLLKKENKPKVLLLFVTGTLKSYYNHALRDSKNENLEIFTFWDFMKKKFNLDIENYGMYTDNGNNNIGLDALNKINSTQLNLYYDFIFIDEAQDFFESWGQLVFNLAKGNDIKEKNVIALFDSRQDIYGKKQKNIYESFKLDGNIGLTGRSKNLYKCYRNTKNIFELAIKFSDEIESREVDKITFSLKEEDAPRCLKVKYDNDIVKYLNDIIDNNSYDIDLKDICVIYPSKYVRTDKIVELISKLRKGKTQLYRNKKDDNFSFKNNSIKFFSTNYAKGLEFSYVILIDFDSVPDNADKANNIFYTAITRAQLKLDIIYKTETTYINKIIRHLNERKSTSA